MTSVRTAPRLHLTIGLLVIASSTSAYAQAPVYEERTFKERIPPAAVGPGELALAFPPPPLVAVEDAKVGGDLTGFRDLATLTAITNFKGAKGAEIVVPVVLPAKSQPGLPPPAGSGLPQIGALDLLAADVLSAHGPLGSTTLRPDGAAKGVMLITGGIHAREWMAVEAVVRKLQDFQSAEFAASYGAVGKSPPVVTGTRDVFFAENVWIRFIPVLNPGGLAASQAGFDKTYIVTNAPAAAFQVPQHELRGGRILRKNLKGMHGYVLTPVDPNAFLGIDLNRNFQTVMPPKGSSEVETSVVYRGWPDKGPEDLAPETKGFLTAMGRLFDRLPKGARYTGAGYVDVHTNLESVEPAPGDRPLAIVQERFANAVAQAAYGKDSKEDPTIRGSTDDVARLKFGAPVATFELPKNEKTSAPVKPQYAKIPDAFGYTWFIVPSPTKAVNDEFASELATAKKGLDAALDYAAGPPYVRRVLILQDKKKVGQYHMNPIGADAEVVYDRTWTRGADGTVRELPDGTVPAGKERWLNGQAEATFVICFSKPMRTDDTADDPPEALRLVDKGGNEKLVLHKREIDPLTRKPKKVGEWQKGKRLFYDGIAKAVTQVGALRYDYDTWILTVNPKVNPVGLPAITFTKGALEVEAVDSVKLKLDGDPSTVAFYESAKGTFTKYEDGGGAGTDDGGKDRTRKSFSIDNAAPTVVKVGD